MTRRLVLAGVLLAMVAVFFALDLRQWLTLDGLRALQDTVVAWRDARPLLVATGFFLMYVVVTGLSLPGAAVMTIAAGAFFGLWWGLLIVSFASTIGATLAFLVSRYLFRDWVQSRFGSRLKTVNEGMAREGAFYLFTLRLVPLIPFFLINLLMGLTPIRTWVFYWVSQVGMLAGTLVYVNAGTQLARIDSLSGLLSPVLLLSFALLGIFPLLAKKTVEWLQRRRVYRGWKKPATFDRNLVVIGGGAAGLVSAYIAATVKARVTLVEAGAMGGDCLNTGCVPSKALIHSARVAQQVRGAARFGIATAEPRVDFPAVMARVREVIAAIEPHDSVERYKGLGVEVLSGRATLVDPWTLEVSLNDGGARRLTTRALVIAAGAEPVVPRIPGLEPSEWLTSENLWHRFGELSRVPSRLVILGGGPIGCELAQAMARLGSEVTLVELMPRLLGREDPDVSDLVSASLVAEGVRVMTGARALRGEREGDQRRLVVKHRDQELDLPFDELICALGRRPRLSGYGLEALGIATDHTLDTNEYLQTLYPNILAAGDVAGPYQLTHAAAHQAWYAAVNALFGPLWRFRADYRVIPAVTFVDPEVARVGLNEQEAADRGIAVEVTRYDLADLDRAIADGSALGFVKVLTPPGRDRILGATIVGPGAGELLAEFVLAMKHGIGLRKLLGTIHSYPTLAEANKFAAGEWQRRHAPQGLLRWVERYHRWRRGGASP